MVKHVFSSDDDRAQLSKISMVSMDGIVLRVMWWHLVHVVGGNKRLEDQRRTLIHLLGTHAFRRKVVHHTLRMLK